MPEQSIHTGGGAAVGGDVEVQGGGDFVGRDQININVTWQTAPFELAEPDLERLRRDYLAYLREAYQYLDIKLLQLEKVAYQLPLSAVYVPLRARSERPAGETWLRVAGRLLQGQGPGEDELLGGRAFAAEPVPAHDVLRDAPAAVLLGDPGAGKSTLLKTLALALAQRPGPLPILIPLNAYAAALQERGEMSLRDFFPLYFATRWRRLRDLDPLFEAALKAGQAVVLLDGLDEVQQQRAFMVRLVQDFATECIPRPARAGEPPQGNRLLVSSRIVGYDQAPLEGPRWRTYTLVDFGREEIERFAGAWTLAFERAVQGDTEMAHQAAQAEREELLASIFGNPGIERLASNPLLLTILALIKRQGVTLPQRRVELYELYLKTLISSWNKARSLDNRPVGPDMDYLETVQVLAPLGLWLRQENPTHGLVSRTALENWLCEYYKREWALAPGPARQEGRRFLDAVRRYSNLLVERGQEQYGFLHLTFEEMLAAKGIAAQAQLGPDEAVRTITRYLGDPAWRETILLAVGALGVVGQQPLAAGAVLDELCQVELEGEKRGLNVVIAGEALYDVGAVGVGGRRVAARVQDCLLHTAQDAAVTPQLRRQAGLVLGRLDWLPDDLDAWIEIPPGPFLYGDKQEQREIPHRYWISKYPITNIQYRRFIEDGGYGRRELWSEDGWAWRAGTYDSQADKDLQAYLARRPPEKRDRPFWWNDQKWNNPLFPVVGVSWFEAQAYCCWLMGKWANGQMGKFAPGTRDTQYVIRLPTEEEWERAARGTRGRVYPWGDEFDWRRANCADGWAGRELADYDAWEQWYKEGIPDFAATTAVCTYPQGVNSEGLWDAAGNVWEWTLSRWEQGDRRRVVRGGAWDVNHDHARCAYRNGVESDVWYLSLGFGVAASLALVF